VVASQVNENEVPTGTVVISLNLKNASLNLRNTLRIPKHDFLHLQIAIGLCFTCKLQKRKCIRFHHKRAINPNPEEI